MKTITKLSVTDSESLITIANVPNDTGVMSEILTGVANADINVDMINLCSLAKSGEISFSFTISSSDLNCAMQVLGKFKLEYPKLVVEINSENTKLCIYGELMAKTCGVGAELLTLLAKNEIDLRLITTSETDISILVADSCADKAAALLQEHYGLKIS